MKIQADEYWVGITAGNLDEMGERQTARRTRKMG